MEILEQYPDYDYARVTDEINRIRSEYIFTGC